MFNAVDRRGADTIAILRYRAIPPLLSHYLASAKRLGGYRSRRADRDAVGSEISDDEARSQVPNKLGHRLRSARYIDNCLS